jgi:hypothetical protein
MPTLSKLWILLLIPVLSSVACIRFHGPRDLRRELSESAGVRLEREMGFTVTRSGVWLARLGMKFVDDEDIPVSLKGVKRVQVGVYTVDGLARGHEERSPLWSEELLEGWQPWMRVQEDDEEVVVLVDEHGGSIRGLVVVVAEEDEWVLIRMTGKLDRVIESAIEMAFDEADRPDLYARSRDERGLESESARADDKTPATELANWQPVSECP